MWDADGKMLISRQLTPLSITSPRQPSSLVAVVRDEEAVRGHKRAAMTVSVKDIRATYAARSPVLMQVEHSAYRSLVRDYLNS